MKVILYVMDSLRPDFLSCYGYHKQTSPNIDHFSRQAVLFENAYSVSTWTRPAGASLLTGMYPDALGLETMDDYFISDIARLPQLFKNAGFKTIAISAMPNISAHFGFDRGFDKFVDLYKDDSVGAEACEKTNNGMFRRHLKQEFLKNATSEDINRYAFDFLDSAGSEKFFMFIWSIDTHAPYFIRGATDLFDKPSNQEVLYYQDIVEMKSKSQVDRLIDIYEKMIYYNDYQFGRFVKKLVELGLYDETMIIVVSDHGEAFMEHGFNGHNGPPYDNQIRIAMLIKFPENRFLNIRCDATVQLIDIFPTLLSYFGIVELSPVVQGEDLLPWIYCDQPVDRNIYTVGNLDSLYGRYRALRNSRWKLIRYELQRPSLRLFRRGIKPIYRYLRRVFGKREMLFDLLEDPGEQNCISQEQVEEFSNLYNDLSHTVAANAEIRSQTKSMDLSCDTKEHGEVKRCLQSLGYFQ